MRVLPEEINRYVSIIDNYERPDPVKDLNARRTRSVNLHPTKREVPVRQKAQASDSANEQVASNNANRDGQGINNNESIRQSVDTSATLSVNEERTVGNEEQVLTVPSAKNDEDIRKSEQTAKKSATLDNNTLKKPPVVPTPKLPSTTNNSSNAASKNINNNTPKTNNDSIKELIEEKSN